MATTLPLATYLKWANVTEEDFYKFHYDPID